jgi:hypothetical protein
VGPWIASLLRCARNDDVDADPPHSLIGDGAKT